MKCDELQERWFEAYPVEGDQIIPTKVYGKKDTDEAIAELKCEFKDVTDDRNEFKKLYSEQTEKLCIEKSNVDTLEQALNQMQRALWLARANRAHAEWGHWATIWFCRTSAVLNINKSSVSQDPYRCTIQRNAAIWRNMWNEVERKCRAKAEEYK